MVNTQLFQTRPGAQLPAANTHNAAQAPAYAFSPRHQLAQLAATGCLSQTFYASAEDQLQRVLALAQGLEPCPVMAALALRLAWADQPEGRLAREHRAPDGSVTVMSLPFLSEPPGEPGDDYGFYLIRAEGQLWLRGYVAPADHIWAPQDVLVWAKVSPA